MKRAHERKEKPKSQSLHGNPVVLGFMKNIDIQSLNAY